MEEIILGLFFTAEELYIIHNKDINTAIKIGKLIDLIVLNCIHIFDGETL